MAAPEEARAEGRRGIDIEEYTYSIEDGVVKTLLILFIPFITSSKNPLWRISRTAKRALGSGFNTPTKNWISSL